MVPPMEIGCDVSRHIVEHHPNISYQVLFIGLSIPWKGKIYVSL